MLYPVGIIAVPLLNSQGHMSCLLNVKRNVRFTCSSLYTILRCRVRDANLTWQCPLACFVTLEDGWALG